MPDSPNAFEDKLNSVAGAWAKLRPAKSFAGMTLTQFQASIQSSLDARTEIENLETQLTNAITRRDKSDAQSNVKLLQVVNSVKGDPEEGEDGDLYATMGYVRKSDRQSGLTRKKKTPELQVK